MKPVVGQKFGRLTLNATTAQKTGDGHLLADWSCECGKVVTLSLSRVKRGLTKSCGCLLRDLNPGLKHGMRGSPEYSTWVAMKGRCLSRTHKDYPAYGAKGIAVCDAWIASFEAFYEHIGTRPGGTSIDRIDVTKGYEPGNVRWATSFVQNTNKANSIRWIVQGVAFDSLYAAGAYFGVSSATINRWVCGHKDPRRNTPTVPPKPNCYKEARYATRV